MYDPRTRPLPSSLSLAWLPAWVWVPTFLLAAPLASSPSSANKALRQARWQTAPLTATVWQSSKIYGWRRAACGSRLRRVRAQQGALRHARRAC
ncbi:hypothetical protein B0H15DRAFT_289719 [Mycena belliarum]|uniref:Secreted protein n=1 Tax=Mycena belliarum TaxID=1033014 RepID=A0AAD6XQV9_9AGAR|nr:hypothetical protein B0H15DRAFT_289719 [Mycena belliae]